MTISLISEVHHESVQPLLGNFEEGFSTTLSHDIEITPRVSQSFALELTAGTEVDHQIPWGRTPENAKTLCSQWN